MPIDMISTNHLITTKLRSDDATTNRAGDFNGTEIVFARRRRRRRGHLRLPTFHSKTQSALDFIKFPQYDIYWWEMAVDDKSQRNVHGPDLFSWRERVIQ